ASARRARQKVRRSREFADGERAIAPGPRAASCLRIADGCSDAQNGRGVEGAETSAPGLFFPVSIRRPFSSRTPHSAGPLTTETAPAPERAKFDPCRVPLQG